MENEISVYFLSLSHPIFSEMAAPIGTKFGGRLDHHTRGESNDRSRLLSEADINFYINCKVWVPLLENDDLF